MEIILGELRLGDLGSVVIASVTSSTIARIFLGDRPAFAIPAYGMKTPWEVFLYVILGVISAFVAVGFTCYIGLKIVSMSGTFPMHSSQPLVAFY